MSFLGSSHGVASSISALTAIGALLTSVPVLAQSVTAPSQLTLTPYAQLIVNVGVNTGTAQPSQDAPTGAPPGSLVGDGLQSDGSFIITARQSRFGVDGTYPVADDLDAQGKIEVDLWGLHEDGGPTGLTQPSLRVRLAFATVGDGTWSVVAGQTWSVVTPRLPLSIGHSAIVLHTGAGVPWQRLPQVGIAYRPALEDAEKPSHLSFQLAAVRSVSGEAGSDAVTRSDNPDPGSASRFPGVEAHLGFEGDHVAVGAGGHWSRERFQTTDAAGESGDVEVTSWLASTDFRLTTKWLWIAAQVWRGANLNGHFSRQGVKLTRGASDPADPAFNEIRSVTPLPATGAWAELGVPVTPRFKLAVSLGLELGDRDKLAIGGTERNVGIFGGAFYSPADHLTTSLEYYRTDTKYHAASGAPDAQAYGRNDNVTLNLKLDLE